jgi:hypothetical protein
MRTHLASGQPQNDNYPIGMEGLPATASDVYRLLGDIDPIIAERIVETGATSDEIGEALARVEDEIGFGEESHEPATSRVNDVISALRDLFDEEEDGYDY